MSASRHRLAARSRLRAFGSCAAALAVAVVAALACGGETPQPSPRAAATDPTAGDPGAAPELVLLSPEKLATAGLATARTERRPLTAEIETTGSVGYEEDRVAHVSPRIPGRVVEVPARLGDRVRTGEILAVLDSVELGQAKAAYLASRAREEVSEEAYQRESSLYADRISSQKEMLEARAEHREAQAAREEAQETLRLYGIGEGELQQMKAGDRTASRLELRAPIAGTVVEKHATLGEVVSPENNPFTVADLRHVWIWIDVFEHQLSDVHLDDEATVRVDSYPDRSFSGKITYLASQVATETRTVRARIDVVNEGGLLRPGMFATVRLRDLHSDATPAVVVPGAAVQQRNGQALVFVPRGEGRFEPRPVRLGRRAGGWIEVVSGLDAGQEVVTEGSFLLKSELAREDLGGEE